MRNIYILAGVGLAFSALLNLSSCVDSSEGEGKFEKSLYTNVNLIDGVSDSTLRDIQFTVENGKITGIGKELDSSGAVVIDLRGKTVMPSLISAHVHIGIVKGTEVSGENYTRENILNQLKIYEQYGISHVQVMGTDRPLLFENGLRDSLRIGAFGGASMLTAGYGFGNAEAVPPTQGGFDQVFRPASVEEAGKEVDELAELQPDLVKIWAEKLGEPGRMSPEIAETIINKAHGHNLRVAAHVYYLKDARYLLHHGLDLFAHSIRDSLVDDASIEDMKKRSVAYIPTLSLDKYSYAYAESPEWVDEPFFTAKLGEGVQDMLKSEAFRNEQRSSVDRNKKAFEQALENVRKLHGAGVKILLGTDSGAFPIRVPGFSEHLELELLVQAGLTPYEAILAGTRNAAEALKIDQDFGTLVKGKAANFIVLDADPTIDIRYTRRIHGVYKAGVEVSRGPLDTIEDTETE